MSESGSRAGSCHSSPVRGAPDDGTPCPKGCCDRVNVSRAEVRQEARIEMRPDHLRRPGDIGHSAEKPGQLPAHRGIRRGRRDEYRQNTPTKITGRGPRARHVPDPFAAALSGRRSCSLARSLTAMAIVRCRSSVSCRSRRRLRRRVRRSPRRALPWEARPARPRRPIERVDLMVRPGQAHLMRVDDDLEQALDGVAGLLLPPGSVTRVTQQARAVPGPEASGTARHRYRMPPPALPRGHHCKPGCSHTGGNSRPVGRWPGSTGSVMSRRPERPAG
jgi:hypothetical protein